MRSDSPKSAYLRWSSEISACKKTNSLCERRRATQLTSDELATMKKFVTSKKFAHISVSSLHLLALRTGELVLLSRYLVQVRARLGIRQRPWTKKTKKVVKTGIRAKIPNEIWHLDVTVVNIRPGVKLFIQAVIDNFSRFNSCLAGHRRNQREKNTVETLKLAAQKAKELLAASNSTNVMMDPGTGK